MINIGKYIEIAINWLTEHFARFFDVINDGVGGFIDAFQDGLTWIPFYVMILGLALLAWFKAGKGVGVFTALGLLLIYGMGFWVETMQTLALVLSSTIIALMIGVPLGIWTARSDRADKIIHPVLDLMQTMPAFVYLIPAVLFFGLRPEPGQRFPGGSVGGHAQRQHHRQRREERILPLGPGLAQQLRGKGGVGRIRVAIGVEDGDRHIPGGLRDRLSGRSRSGAAREEREAEEKRQEMLFHQQGHSFQRINLLF